MFFAISLLSSIVFYSLDISLDLTEERILTLQLSTKFLTSKALTKLLMFILILILIGIVAFNFADRLAKTGAQIPSLHKRALKTMK